MPPIVNLPGGPWAENSAPVWTGQVVNATTGLGIPAANLASASLTIVDTLTGKVILAATNVLNTGRGAFDSQGNFTITLQASDTSMSEVPGATQIERSLILNWTTTGLTPNLVGRVQRNFTVLRLAG